MVGQISILYLCFISMVVTRNAEASKVNITRCFFIGSKFDSKICQISPMLPIVLYDGEKTFLLEIDEMQNAHRISTHLQIVLGSLLKY